MNGRRRRSLKIGPVEIYQAAGHLGCVTPWFTVVAFPLFVWLRPGWFHAGKVGGSWVFRIGPSLVTLWRGRR